MARRARSAALDGLGRAARGHVPGIGLRNRWPSPRAGTRACSDRALRASLLACGLAGPVPARGEHPVFEPRRRGISAEPPRAVAGLEIRGRAAAPSWDPPARARGPRSRPGLARDPGARLGLAEDLTLRAAGLGLEAGALLLVGSAHAPRGRSGRSP
jgi:hypothetical protein